MCRALNRQDLIDIPVQNGGSRSRNAVERRGIMAGQLENGGERICPACSKCVQPRRS